jgi:hypothetical protein
MATNTYGSIRAFEPKKAEKTLVSSMRVKTRDAALQGVYISQRKQNNSKRLEFFYKNLERLSLVLINPVNKVAGLGVDSRISGRGTSSSPGNNSDMCTILKHWSARISLTRIFTNYSGTNHRIGNVIFAIAVPAIFK